MTLFSKRKTANIPPKAQTVTEVVPPEHRNRHLAKRCLDVLAHGFELVLVALIAFASLLLLVPLEKVAQHVCESITTISLVHCVDMVRKINSRVSIYRDYQWQATELGYLELAKEYHGLAEGADIFRRTLLVFTVMSGLVWATVSISYACYLSPISGEHSEKTIVNVVVKTPEYLTDPWKIIRKLSLYGEHSSENQRQTGNDDSSQHNSDGNESEVVRDQDGDDVKGNKPSPGTAVVKDLKSENKIPRVPTIFLNLIAGAGAGFAFAVSAAKVIYVSHHPKDLSVEWFVRKLNIEKQPVSDSNGADQKNVSMASHSV